MRISISFRGGRELRRAWVMLGYAETSEMEPWLDTGAGGNWGVGSWLDDSWVVCRRLDKFFSFYMPLVYSCVTMWRCWLTLPCNDDAGVRWIERGVDGKHLTVASDRERTPLSPTSRVLIAASCPLSPVSLSAISGLFKITWLVHFVPRRWQVMQIAPSSDEKVHLTFLCLHSQQLCVPLRTFLRFGAGSSEGATIWCVGCRKLWPWQESLAFVRVQKCVDTLSRSLGRNDSYWRCPRRFSVWLPLGN
jgi:hypothetical protein